MPLDRLGNGTGLTGSASSEATVALTVPSSHLTPQFIQLCVIVQRDDKGYGLTVSGDNPVHVQSVREDGAAARAGVHQGDRIAKVNGTWVTNCNHNEVVELIKAGSSVALTILRKPDTSNRLALDMPVSKSSLKKASVTDPVAINAQLEQQLSKEKLSHLRHMLDAAKIEEEKCQQEHGKAKTSKTNSRLSDAKKVVETLRIQIQNATVQLGQELFTSSVGTSRGITATEPHRRRPSQTSLEATCSDTDQQVFSASPTWGALPVTNLATAAVEVPSDFVARESRSPGAAPSDSNAAPLRRVANNDEGGAATDRAEAESSCVDAVDFSGPIRSAASINTPYTRTSFGKGMEEYLEEVKTGLTAGSPSIISMEDDDFPDEAQNATKDHGPFNDFELLKKKHAHCSVFLTYLSSNGDPAALLFHLITDIYMQGNLKDMKKWAYEIHSTFLVKDAPLRVTVDDSVVQVIDSILERRLDKEDVMRNLFAAARLQSRQSIVDDLAQFRSKRDLGLDNMFSDGELYEMDMDRGTEIRIVERRLRDLYEKFKNDGSPRGECLTYSLVALMKDWGLPKLSSGMSSMLPLGAGGNGLDRAPSLLMKDKTKLGSILGRLRKESIKNHGFVPQMYQSTTFCDVCKTVMWGIGYQGLQCQTCEINVHKDCLSRVEACQKKRKAPRIPVIKKTSSAGSAQPAQPVHTVSSNLVVNTTSAVAGGEAREPLVSPLAQSSKNEPDSALSLGSHGGTHSVSNIVKRFEQDADQVLPSSMPPPASSPGDVPDISHGSSSNSIHASVASGTSGISSGAGSVSLSPSSVSSSVGRSESFNDKTTSQDVQGLRSRDGRRSRSDVDQNEDAVLQGIAAQPHQSSSSTSSLASAKSDSGTSETSAAADVITKVSAAASKAAQSLQLLRDSDLEVELEMPSIESLIPKEQLRKLKPKERKRQEIINELFYTERSHVRNLKILDKLFHVPMSAEPGIPSDVVRLLFANIGDVIKVHCALNDAMRKRQKESALVFRVGDVLVEHMDGTAGERMKEVCAEYCKEHKLAGETLKLRRRRDTKLQEIIQTAESSPHCRRLQLHDLLIAEVQRLTKYPLLIDSLLKYTSETSDKEEYENLLKASQLSEALLGHVNNAVKAGEDQHTLAALQKRLDTTPLDKSTAAAVTDFKNLDLTKHQLIYNGHLSLRLAGRKPVSLHVVLLKDMLVLLHMQDDNRLVLKCLDSQTGVGRDDPKSLQSPVLRLSGILARPVATDKRAFFVISMSDQSRQMYELVATSVEERKRWVTYIADAVDSLKDPNSLAALHTQMRSKHATHMTPSSILAATHQQGEGIAAPSTGATLSVVQEDTGMGSESSCMPCQLSETGNDDGVTSPGSSSGRLPAGAEDDGSQLMRDDSACSMAEHSEPSIEERLGQEREPLVSYARLLQEKDDVIAQALADKNQILSDALYVSGAELDSEAAAEVSRTIEGERDPRALVLASISEAMNLTALLSAEADGGSVAALPLRASAAGCATAAAANLSRQLNSLLDVVVEREAENARLRKQLSHAQRVLSSRGLLLMPSVLLGDCDSRPLSYISNSSDFVSGDEANALDSEHIHGSLHRRGLRRNSSSAAEEEELEDEGVEEDGEREGEAAKKHVLETESAVHSEQESTSDDSDDEGTVYADAMDSDSTHLSHAHLPRTNEYTNETGTDEETLKGDDLPLDGSPASTAGLLHSNTAAPGSLSAPPIDDSHTAHMDNSLPKHNYDCCHIAAAASISSDSVEAMSVSNTTSDSLEFNDAQTNVDSKGSAKESPSIDMSLSHVSCTERDSSFLPEQGIPELATKLSTASGDTSSLTPGSRITGKRQDSGSSDESSLACLRAQTDAAGSTVAVSSLPLALSPSVGSCDDEAGSGDNKLAEQATASCDCSLVEPGGQSPAQHDKREKDGVHCPADVSYFCEAAEPEASLFEKTPALAVLDNSSTGVGSSEVCPTYYSLLLSNNGMPKADCVLAAGCSDPQSTPKWGAIEAGTVPADKEMAAPQQTVLAAPSDVIEDSGDVDTDASSTCSLD